MSGKTIPKDESKEHIANFRALKDAYSLDKK